MSLYICRQCASTTKQHALRAVTHQARRIGVAVQSETTSRMDTGLTPFSSLAIFPRRVRKGTRSLSSSTSRPLSRKITLDDFLTTAPPPPPPTPPLPSPVPTPTSPPTPSPKPPTSASVPQLSPCTRRPLHPKTILLRQQRAEREKIRLHIHDTKQRIDQYTKSGQVDQLYLEFWKICATESIQTQYLIWRRTPNQHETIYRVFNSLANPSQTIQTLTQDNWADQGYSVGLEPLQITLDPALLESIKPKRSSTTTTPSATPSSKKTTLAPPLPTSTPKPSLRLVQPSKGSSHSTTSNTTTTSFTIQFITRSHQHRLYQMHQYFETVLGLRIGYYARVALLTAFATAGDTITSHGLFRQWEPTAGKEMYSAMIRGLVGQDFQSSTHALLRSPHAFDSISRHPTTGLRNRGVTQINAALELFYELQRRGGKPTFEMYHSLVVGMATFKNNMEAAEMLLEHMIIQKGKPYVQVLHVMIREYARRRDLESAERIFGLLSQYRIQPRAMTCNMILGAIFRMTPMEAQAYLDRTPLEELRTFHQTTRGKASDQTLWPSTTASTTTTTTTTSFSALVRKKVADIRAYMRTSRVEPDEATYSTLIYGYGHLEGGYPDLRTTMRELGQSKIQPNLVILNSLIFAHLNHGQPSVAESILDKMLNSFHPLTDSMIKMKSTQRFEQRLSPFKKNRAQAEEETEMSKEKDATREDSSETSTTTLRESEPPFVQELKRRLQQWRMFPGKGTFHALMLAHIERGDIRGMERIVDKMIVAQRRQQEQREHHAQARRALAELLSSTHSNSQPTSVNSLLSTAFTAHVPILRTVDLEADEYTANIMLLGYLTERNLEKAELVHQRIQARSDWRSWSNLFEEREASRRALIEYVREKSSKAIVRRVVSRVPEREAMEEEAVVQEMEEAGDEGDSGSGKDSTHQTPLKEKEELDDDIEIDVTTLSAKLRGLMSSTRTFP